MIDIETPQRPLPDLARARRRDELLTAIQDDRTGARAWLLPVGAAAAVVAVISVVVALAQGADPAPDTLPPAATSESPLESSESPAEPTAPETETTRLSEAEGGPAQGSLENPPVPCGELEAVPGGAEVGAIEIGETTVRVYSNGSEWATCDEFAALDGGEATLFAPQPVGAEPAKELYLISMNAVDTGDGLAQQYVAGGLLQGATGITYTFPDGHVQEAVIDGDVWAMAYFPTSGPMSGGRLPAEPIAVEVKLSGVIQTYELRDMDWCGQVNHGC